MPQIILAGVLLTVEIEYCGRGDYPQDKQHLWSAYPLERYNIISITAQGDIFDLLSDRQIQNILQLLHNQRQQDDQ